MWVVMQMSHMQVKIGVMKQRKNQVKDMKKILSLEKYICAEILCYQNNGNSSETRYAKNRRIKFKLVSSF